MKTTIRFQIGNIAIAREIARECRCYLYNVRDIGTHTWADVLHLTLSELECFEDRYYASTDDLLIIQEDLFYKMEALK